MTFLAKRSSADEQLQKKKGGPVFRDRPVWKRFLQTIFGELRFPLWPIRAIAP
jgi:hypothetical protein